MIKISTIPDDFEPQSGVSNFLKLTPGKHRIRILSGAVAGYEWWEDTPEGGRKPKRIALDGNPPVEYAESVRKFLAFPIYNYELSKIQVMEITQASIQKELKALEKDPDWANLIDFDLEIERTGNDKNTTRYRITPKPKSEMSKEVQKAAEAGLPVLDALFKGQDPFSYNPNAEEVDVEEIDKIFAEEDKK